LNPRTSPCRSRGISPSRGLAGSGQCFNPEGIWHAARKARDLAKATPLLGGPACSEPSGGDSMQASRRLSHDSSFSSSLVFSSSSRLSASHLFGASRRISFPKGPRRAKSPGRPWKRSTEPWPHKVYSQHIMKAFAPRPGASHEVGSATVERIYGIASMSSASSLNTSWNWLLRSPSNQDPSRLASCAA
jgi:hypothetical protein